MTDFSCKSFASTITYIMFPTVSHFLRTLNRVNRPFCRRYIGRINEKMLASNFLNFNNQNKYNFVPVTLLMMILPCSKLKENLNYYATRNNIVICHAKLRYLETEGYDPNAKIPYMILSQTRSQRRFIRT